MIAPPRPPQDRPELIVEAARERQRRRRLLGASVAVAAGLALGVFAVAGGLDRSRTALNPSGPGGVSPCRASQISVSVPMLVGVLEKGRTGLFVMKNVSGSPCSLPLRPPRASVTLRGGRLPVRQVAGRGIVLGSWMPLRATRLLKPGGKAAISSYWQNWCGAPHSNRPIFTLHFRFDRRLAVPLRIGPHPFCANRSQPSTIRVSRPLLVRS